MNHLPIAPKESIVYEDEKLYVCLALFPITKGHTVVVWKKHVEDIKALSFEEYDYLMNIVDVTRDMLLKVFGVEKVYMLYMDEVRHVHWHLVPRYNEKGFDVFAHEPKKTKDFLLQGEMERVFQSMFKKRVELSGK